LQLGEFMLKQHRVEPLRRSVSSLSDFTDVFGTEETSLHCAEVRHTQNRYWWRLVGRRHDIQLWKSPNEDCWPPLRHRGEFSRRFPADLRQGTEGWILGALNQAFRGNSWRVKGLNYHLQSSACTRSSTCARLCISGSLNEKGDVTLKEMVVFREPVALQIYDIVEHGRRWYRTLSYSSSTTHVLDSSPTPQHPLQVLTTPTNRHASIIITRHVTKALGKQMYVPKRLLRGLLPHALLEKYMFWQSMDVMEENTSLSKGEEVPISLVGYQKKKSSTECPTQLHVSLLTGNTPGDSSGFCGAAARAIVTRINVISSSANTDSSSAAATTESNPFGIGVLEQIDSEYTPATLLNILYAGRGSAGGTLRQIRMLASRLDSLSHCLAWTHTPSLCTSDGRGSILRSKTSIQIDRLEFPRLNLSFTNRANKLYSNDHEGLYLAPKAPESLASILTGLPHAVILRNDASSYFLLLPSTAKAFAKHSTVPGDGGFSEHTLRINHGEEVWREKISSHVRHYLYPIHTSQLFLSTPTLSSALYLLLVRFLSGHYDRVFLLTRFCLKDIPLSSEERQIVNQLSEVQYDRHPNAIACRLQLRMVTRGTPMESDLPFESLPQEYFSYLSVLPHITARCRLTLREELTCARLASNSFDRSNEMYEENRLSEDQLCVLENRRLFLEWCMDESSIKSKHIRLRCPPPFEPINQYNEEVDRTVLQDENQLTSIISKLSTVSYSRPKDADLHSLLAAQNLHVYLQNGLSLRGGTDSPGFLFL
jgi:hypothetical protein